MASSSLYFRARETLPTIGSLSPKAKTSLVSAVVLTGISALAVGLITHFGLISLPPAGSWALIGSGGAALLSGLLIETLVRSVRHGSPTQNEGDISSDEKDVSSEAISPVLPGSNTQSEEGVGILNRDESLLVILRSALPFIGNKNDASRMTCVSRTWNMVMIRPEMQNVVLQMDVYGSGVWNRYLGKVQEVRFPNLTFLKDPCPFWPGERIGDTHQVILMPPTINGNPLTHDTLDLCMSGAKRVGYLEDSFKPEDVRHQPEIPEIFSEIFSKPTWILITKKPIPNARIQVDATTGMRSIEGHEEYRLPFTLELSAFTFLKMFFSTPNQSEYPEFSGWCQEHASQCFGARDGHPECPRIAVSKLGGGVKLEEIGEGRRAIYVCRIIPELPVANQ